MSKLPKQKRDRLILLALGTGGVITMIWSAFIYPLQTALQAKGAVAAQAEEKLRTAKRNVERAEKSKSELAAAEQKLRSMETKMAAGDVYRWITRTFSAFQTSDKVDIPAIDPPRIGDPAILPKVPYKAATFSISGTAYYDDFGKFLANLENSYPHIRLQSLELEPTHFGEPNAAEDEKLNFRMELVTLAKPPAPSP